MPAIFAVPVGITGLLGRLVHVIWFREAVAASAVSFLLATLPGSVYTRTILLAIAFQAVLRFVLRRFAGMPVGHAVRSHASRLIFRFRAVSTVARSPIVLGFGTARMTIAELHRVVGLWFAAVLAGAIGRAAAQFNATVLIEARNASAFLALL